MKKRVMRGSVTVIGPPRRIWSWKIGTTLPSEPSTLPNRTTVKQVEEACDMAWTKRSAICLDTPMMLDGWTALSVEMKTKFFTPNSWAKSAMILVPPTLLRMASPTFISISGTCLWAAAWKTTSGRYWAKICRIRGRSVTSAMQDFKTAAA